MLFFSCILIPFWFLFLKLNIEYYIMFFAFRFSRALHVNTFLRPPNFYIFAAYLIYCCFRICGEVIHLINPIVQLYYHFMLISKLLSLLSYFFAGRVILHVFEHHIQFFYFGRQLIRSHELH